jgi:hypothetical protein
MQLWLCEQASARTRPKLVGQARILDGVCSDEAQWSPQAEYAKRRSRAT